MSDLTIAAVAGLAWLLPLGTRGQMTRTAQRAAADLWVLALLGGVAGWLLGVEPWLGVMALALLWWWARPADARPGPDSGPVDRLPTLIRWAALGATWGLAQALSAPAWRALLVAWTVTGCGLAGVMLWQRARGRPAVGWLGQRAVAGAAFGLLLPLAPLPAWPLLLAGLWLSGPAWLAVLAAGAGCVVRWPACAPWAAVGLALGVATVVVSRRVWPILAYTPRGHNIESLGVRVRLLRHAAVALVAAGPAVWLRGFGPGAAERHTYRWALRDPRLEATGSLHNEPAELVFEHGALGALALALFCWRVAPHLTLGDPASAAAVAGAILAGGLPLSRLVPLGVPWLILLARVAA